MGRRNDRHRPVGVRDRGERRRYLAQRPGRAAPALRREIRPGATRTCGHTRSPEVAGGLARGLFPATLVEPETVDATEALLVAANPPGLRRKAGEGRDDLARALRARAAR